MTNILNLCRSFDLRIGILGGTFDPPHHGHLMLARHFTDLLRLSELVLLPAGQPWQKAHVSSAHHRLAMTRLAAKQLIFPDTSVVVAPDEIEVSGPTYTVNTLAKWRQRIGQHASLSLLIGADQLLRLESWRHWRRLFDYAHICVAARRGFALSLVPSALAIEVTQRQANAQVIQTQSHGLMLVDTALMIDISATQIRQSTPRLIAQNQTSEAVPIAIWRYICQHHLYRS